MADHSAKEHYENLLASHYSWMFGDFNRQVRQNLKWFDRHQIQPKSGKKAIDFGCGSGFQSIALSSLGYHVTAVDFNRQLLDELKDHDENQSIELIQSDILNPENYSHNAPFELGVCMGDTLPHLPSEDSVSNFFQSAYELLETEGILILSFRDYSTELTGLDRFIPVQSDDEKIMTVYLEYEKDHIMVHDLVYELKNGMWELDKSVYKKVRLTGEQVKGLLEKSNFKVRHMESKQGMIHIMAGKA